MAPNQPFPAILFSNYNTKTGRVHGYLSQDVFYHNYSFRHAESGIEMQAYSSFKAISHMEPPSLLLPMAAPCSLMRMKPEH